MREVKIPINPKTDAAEIERCIERAIADNGLNITLCASLRKFPGCVHWHVKRGHEAGTLEITFWPAEHRAWFSVQSGRKAGWIDEKLKRLMDALRCIG